MAATFEFQSKLTEVVNLPVVDDAEGSIFVEYRLVTAGKVNDAETTYAQPGAIFDENTFIIRPPMNNTLTHPVNPSGLNSVALRVDHPRDSAHVICSPRLGRC